VADSAQAALATGTTSNDRVAEIIRNLEITINRRLDGVLHGNHQGLTPGHGTEPGESRRYEPGDDVRRIDWNVTARTREVHVRDQIADRDLVAWLVVDASASMRFGTTRTDKASIALAATGAIGFLTARNQNRLGAVIVTGAGERVIPPASGRGAVQAILRSVADTDAPDGSGRATLSSALDRVGAIERRRGFVSVISDFAGSSWFDSLARLGLRHDLLSLRVTDRRESDLPAIGLVELRDPATGLRREVRVTPQVQRRFARRAELRHHEMYRAMRRAGAELIELNTSDDWLGAIVDHVQQRRTQAVRGEVLRR
jgi:uncharacterized protein (DUF58 family)